MANKATVKEVFDKVGLLTKATECLDSAKLIYHEHFAEEIANDDKYKHIATELEEIKVLLAKERSAFNNKVETLEIFKNMENKKEKKPNQGK
jgi:predicted ribosome quality control (RQC) complex YloA/Tae2 family protein